MAENLTALGEPVTDRTLILNVIRGPNERFSHVGTLLRRARPFPSFPEARDDLILEKLTLENQKDAPATVLVISTTLHSPSPAPVSSNTGASSTGGGPKSSNNRRSKLGSSDKGSSDSGASAGQGPRPSSSSSLLACSNSNSLPLVVARGPASTTRG